jgi:hypothetical protein
MRAITVALTAAAALLGGETYQGRPAMKIANDRLEVLILPQGATIASVVQTADSGRLNPLWLPVPDRSGAGIGHFLCLDGFGSPSPQEKAAGLPGHGEAVRQDFTTVKQAGDQLVLNTTLPVAQERVTRMYRLRPGEEVLYVDTRVESLVGVDRPMVWAEHATIGSPFLEAGITAVDVSGARSQTRPYSQQPGRRRLASGKDFTWPMAPLAAGGTVDVRTAPVPPDSMDHTTTALDATRKYAYVTAVHPKRGLLVGWIWRTADYPWLQSWESYSASAMARGLEFSTQPYDIPRREAVDLHRLFDTPTFRWLPAKSAVETSFVLFYTRVPEGFTRVRDVRVADGAIAIEDGTGKHVKLTASGLIP